MRQKKQLELIMKNRRLSKQAGSMVLASEKQLTEMALKMGNFKKDKKGKLVFMLSDEKPYKNSPR